MQKIGEEMSKAAGQQQSAGGPQQGPPPGASKSGEPAMEEAEVEILDDNDKK